MFVKTLVLLSLGFPVFGADLTVHEWGTFTSVAGESGAPVRWASLAAPSDLPCFVYRLSAQCVKCNLTTMVRMETPVVYFYAATPTTVSVHVDLPSGVITEWYPKAGGLPKDTTYGNGGKIDWGPVELLPGARLEFPTDGSDSHYYPARNTDSAALRVQGEQEKLLFYRGIADEGVSLEAQLAADSKLELRNTASDAIPFAVVFENRGGKSGYRVVRNLRSRATVEFPVLTAEVADLHRELAAGLTEAGLFPREAAAMVETWRDSWFEEGMRVFYILPRATVDSVLPMKITPAPATTVRVFVGRVEVLSPAVRDTLQAALASGDTATLAKCGRFLEAFLPRVTLNSGVAMSPAARAFLDEQRKRNAQNRVAPCKAPISLPTTNEQ